MTPGAGDTSWASTWSSDGAMRSPVSLFLFAGLLAAAGAGVGVRLHESATAADPRAVLDRYCVGCHNAAERAGGVTLDAAKLDALRDDRALWEHAVRKVRTGFMPPAG